MARKKKSKHCGDGDLPLYGSPNWIKRFGSLDDGPMSLEEVCRIQAQAKRRAEERLAQRVADIVIERLKTEFVTIDDSSD